MARYQVTVYRQGYIRAETTIEVEANDEGDAKDKALGYDLYEGMDIIRSDMETTGVDVSEVR